METSQISKTEFLYGHFENVYYFQQIFGILLVKITVFSKDTYTLLLSCQISVSWSFLIDCGVCADIFTFHHYFNVQEEWVIIFRINIVSFMVMLFSSYSKVMTLAELPLPNHCDFAMSTFLVFFHTLYWCWIFEYYITNNHCTKNEVLHYGFLQ